MTIQFGDVIVFKSRPAVCASGCTTACTAQYWAHYHDRGGDWLKREVSGFQSLPVLANEPTADGVDLDNFRPKMTGLVLFGCRPNTPQSSQQYTHFLAH